MSPSILLVGEVIVDVTITPPGQENKLRLGGITHAARGFWAQAAPYDVAAILPAYLKSQVEDYFSRISCGKVHSIGTISGCPNIILIFDPTEVSDQQYDSILRDEKQSHLHFDVNHGLDNYQDVLIFPGNYDLQSVCEKLHPEARLHIDIAYDVNINTLKALPKPLTTVFLSTSSNLFQQLGKSPLHALMEELSGTGVKVCILKENRGGARIYDRSDGASIEKIPAQLGKTVNSVGVGDVFDASYLSFQHRGSKEAALRASWASSAYAQTTEPDVFRRDVCRANNLNLDELINLQGVTLPWEARASKRIYLAAPDFSHLGRIDIDHVLSALSYHNFNVIRPIQENGELPIPSDLSTLQETYLQDLALLKTCDLVLAIPSGRDPGTLVEIGLAQALTIPVIVYDPSGDSNNTMVVGGCDHYTGNLDAALNRVFEVLSEAGTHD